MSRLPFAHIAHLSRPRLARTPSRLGPLAIAIGSLMLVGGGAFAADAPAVPDSATGAPPPAAASRIDPLACNAATDRANALDMKAANAQAQKTDSTQVAALVDESIGQWQQAVEHCDGRAKERAKRNLADSQRMRASIAVVQGAGEQCESTHKDAGALLDLARQALGERRWQDAAVLFRKSEGLWDLASERCSGSMQDTALKRRDQTEIDSHNAEACAPRFDKARETTQKFRSGSAALAPPERQRQSQIAETQWRELIPECKGSAQDIARNQADTLFRERGTPWVATRPAPSTVAGASPATAAAANPSTAAITAASAKPAAATGTGASAGGSAAPAPGPIDIVVANQTRLKGRFTLDAGGTTYSGNGRMEWANGDAYEGDVRLGLREGQGEFTWANGQRYRGEWVKGEPQGLGLLHFANGNRYNGQVVGGMPTGQGTMTYASGDHYKGQFSEGRPHGEGEMRYASGDVYTGRFEAGHIEGRGRYQWKNGDHFEGLWHAGLKEGPGTMTWASGDRREGLYRGDQFVGAETTTAARAP